MCENCTRRDFLGATAMGGVLLAASQIRGAESVQPSVGLPEKVRICAMFAGPCGPPDRSWGVSEDEVAAMKACLKEVEDKLGNVEFVVGHANNEAEAKQLMAQAGDDAPILAIITNFWELMRMNTVIRESGRPMAVFAQPASGHSWMYPYRWRKEGQAVTMFTSSDYAELENATRVLRVIPLMQKSRILVFAPLRGTPPACSPEEIKKRLGSDVVVVGQERFDELLKSVDPAAAKAEAKEWIDGAKKIIEPNEEDIVKAAAVSIALERLMEEEKAQSLAVGTCMGWLERGFPCLGFTKLRDRGIPASCEGDMDSLLTMMLFGYLFDIPGFQGNATFDTSKNALWTAHCVGPLKMDGPKGEAAPYLLRSHSEIGDGVVPEIQYRLGQEITRTKLVNLQQLLISSGTIREVPEKSIRACRTQIVTEVPDAAKMVRNWGGGVLEGDAMTLLHRVVFYGDHKKNAQHLADLLKMEIVEEG